MTSGIGAEKPLECLNAFRMRNGTSAKVAFYDPARVDLKPIRPENQACRQLNSISANLSSLWKDDEECMTAMTEDKVLFHLNCLFKDFFLEEVYNICDYQISLTHPNIF